MVHVKNVKVIQKYLMMGRNAFQIYVKTDRFLINMELVPNAQTIPSHILMMVEHVCQIHVLKCRSFLGMVHVRIASCIREHWEMERSVVQIYVKIDINY